jgi:hypothetical protein
VINFVVAGFVLRDSVLGVRLSFEYRSHLLRLARNEARKKMLNPGGWLLLVGGKIPHAIGMKDVSPFVVAGLWEGWKDLATGE